ncbi:MAG: hypothetical protein K6F62_00970, partial [Schwartzia sp.]|nr:hypothetical protein [Schwartzia sp. (in: firmicutes)]
IINCHSEVNLIAVVVDLQLLACGKLYDTTVSCRNRSVILYVNRTENNKSAFFIYPRINVSPVDDRRIFRFL